MQYNNGRPPYLVPFSLMVIITIILSYLGYVGLSYFPDVQNGRSLVLYLLLFGWPAVTAIEAVLYWIIRYKIRSSFPVWMHLCCMLLAFIVTNMVSVILDNTLERNADNFSFIIKATRVRSVLIWVFSIVGHAFFVTVLIRALRFKKTEALAEPSIFEDEDIE